MKHTRGKADDDEEWEDGAEHATGGYSEDEDFDYEEYIEREFPSREDTHNRVSCKKWAWRVIVVVICLLLIWRFLML